MNLWRKRSKGRQEAPIYWNPHREIKTVARGEVLLAAEPKLDLLEEDSTSLEMRLAQGCRI